jgi:hypothetical protein
MTAQFRCNGPDCPKVMEKDEPRIAVVYVQPPEPTFEPVDEEGGMVYGALVELDLTIDGGLHFCSNACLIMYGWKARETEAT